MTYLVSQCSLSSQHSGKQHYILIYFLWAAIVARLTRPAPHGFDQGGAASAVVAAVVVGTAVVGVRSVVVPVPIPVRVVTALVVTDPPAAGKRARLVRLG